jgi:hypothetical protein
VESDGRNGGPLLAGDRFSLFHKDFLRAFIPIPTETDLPMTVFSDALLP